MTGILLGYVAVIAMCSFAALAFCSVFAIGFGIAYIFEKIGNLFAPVGEKIGELIGKKILKAQNKPKNHVIPGEFFVPTPNGQLSTLEIKPELNSQDAKPEHYIICFCYNANSYSHPTKMEDMQALAKQNNATVIAFDYPNVGNSTGKVRSQFDLMNAGIAQVERLLNKGIPADQITLYGHSLGGGIATLVTDHYHNPKKHPKLLAIKNIHGAKISLINDRSFSTIGDTVASQIKGPVWLKKAFKYITNPLCKVFNWNVDAAAAYKRIPNNYKMHIVSKIDKVISYKGASLHKNTRTQNNKKQDNTTHLKAYKLYSHKIGGTCDGHAKPLHALTDNKTPANTMNSHITDFIKARNVVKNTKKTA